MVRTFGSPGPAKSVVNNPVEMEFSLYGSDYVFTATPPTGGQMLVLAASMEMEQGTSGMVQFLMNVLSEEDFGEMRRRLLDREDTLSLDDLNDLFQWLMEEWSLVPTAGRSASSASPGPAGRGSTAKPRSRARTSALSK